MRILLISHTCQSRTEGQPKARCLARIPGVELKVLVPDRWKHYGRWREAQPAAPDEFDCTLGKVRWPWVGPAQFYLHWYPELRKIITDFAPDVIDLWEEPWGLCSAHAIWLRDRVRPTAKVVIETEQNIDKKLPFPFERFRRYCLRRADYAVARNQESLSVLRAKGYAGPAEVVPNAVDTDLFRPMDRDAVRATLALPSGFLVGYVGRLVEEKGLTDLVAALADCPTDVSAILVGEGPFHPDLQRQAQALGLTQRLHFLGNRPLEQLPTVMNALDVLALPSRTTSRWKEQFGRVIIEAHACGVPVIGSDSGAIPDVVADGGLVVPECNPPAMAAAIQQFHDAPDRGRSFGEAGRRRVFADYTWQRVAERMHQIYRRVLGGGASESLATLAGKSA
jgi:glycosyltransferase involved in cell wall biosynthesis